MKEITWILNEKYLVFLLQNYCHYILANPFIFYIDHQALKDLVNKLLHHGQICRWLLLFLEIEFKVVVQLGKTNLRPNHLSRIEIG